MTIGERLNFARKKQALTQAQVAEHLDVTRQTISKWELDKSLPSLQEIVKLAELYQLSLDELILGKPGTNKEVSWLKREWDQLVANLTPIEVTEVLRKKANVSLTTLGAESVFQNDLAYRLAQGEPNGTIYLIEGNYYPKTTVFGNRGEQCLVELTEKNFKIFEIKPSSVLKFNWTNHLQLVMELTYEEIAEITIGIQKRSDFIFGMPSDIEGNFYLLMEVKLKNQNTFVFSSLAINQVKLMLAYFNWQQVKVNDPFGLEEVYTNPAIKDPLTYLKRHFEQRLPKKLKDKYDLTI